MEYLFWIMALLIVYTYFGYPLVVVVLSLFFDERVVRESRMPRVTFLVTAYNEERNIRGKIENTLSLDYPRERLEVIVASDGSSDGTDRIVREYFSNGVQLYRVEGRVGKTETQNRVVKAARGDIIIFSDATTFYERSAIRNIVRNFADPRVGAVGGRFRYVDPENTPIGTGTAAFWDYESFIKQRQTKIRTITGCSGCIYAVRKDLYEPLPGDIISDLVEPLKILEKGYRIVYEHAAFAYEIPFQKSTHEFWMRVRVITRGMRGIFYMRRLLNPLRYPFISFQLISHKVLRWLVPVFAIVLYGTSTALSDRNPWYLLSWLAQSVFYVAAFGGLLMELLHRRVRAFALPLYFCVVNAASIVALLRLVARKKDVQWQTVRT